MVSTSELVAFADGVGKRFEAGDIRSPVHLSKGNEKQLIHIFESINEDDWVFSTHRSHYHALLKGIDPDWLMGEILANRSMHINSAEHRFFTSSIVGGCLPIALGVAMGIKKQGQTNKVYIFVGDMAAETGSFHECTKYAWNHDLPIVFVIEDNGLSVNTNTRDAWGQCRVKKPTYYKYEREYPHAGTGVFVSF